MLLKVLFLLYFTCPLSANRTWIYYSQDIIDPYRTYINVSEVSEDLTPATVSAEIETESTVDDGILTKSHLVGVMDQFLQSVKHEVLINSKIAEEKDTRLEIKVDKLQNLANQTFESIKHASKVQSIFLKSKAESNQKIIKNDLAMKSLTDKIENLSDKLSDERTNRIEDNNKIRTTFVNLMSNLWQNVKDGVSGRISEMKKYYKHFYADKDNEFKKKLKEVGKPQYSVNLETVRYLRISDSSDLLNDDQVSVTTSYPRYAKVNKTEDNGWKIYSFEGFLPKGVSKDEVAEFSQFLQAAGCDTVVPIKAFFELAIEAPVDRKEDTFSGEFVIEVDNLEERAMNFLFLASGIRGTTSYNGTAFEIYPEYILGGQKKLDCCDSFLAIKSVVDGITNNDYNTSHLKRGSVDGWNAVTKEKLSIFTIWTEEQNRPSSTKFAEVVSGMEVIQDMINFLNYLPVRKAVIVACGFRI